MDDYERSEDHPDARHYPPILKRAEAAALCRLTPAGFDVWVRKGIVPTAIPGTRRWSRDAILRAINGDVSRATLDPFEQWKLDNAKKNGG